MKLTDLAKSEGLDDVEILAVSIDDREASRGLIGTLDGKPWTFPIRLLGDPKHRVIDRYGLRNETNKRGIPHPATFVIDREGTVRWRFVEKDYSVRPSNDDVIAALKEARG